MPLPFCSFLHLFCFLLEVAHLCNLFIIQISCRNPWIVFAEKGHCTKVVTRKWKIEYKYKYSLQQYGSENMKEQFPQRMKKGIHLDTVQ